MKIKLNELRQIIRSEIKRTLTESMEHDDECKWCGERPVVPGRELPFKGMKGDERMIPACEDCYQDMKEPEDEEHVEDEDGTCSVCGGSGGVDSYKCYGCGGSGYR